MTDTLALAVRWRELLARTLRETVDDDCLGMAAQLAYYLLLALSPAILFLVALASFFPLVDITDDTARLLGPIVSSEVLTLLQREMARLSGRGNAGLLTFGVVAALWSSSAALVTIVASLNKAYDLRESRPWWKVRLVAIGLTFVLAMLVLTSMSLILAGPSVATYLGETVGLGPVFEWSWMVLQWPVAFFLVSTAIGVVYYAGPDRAARWTWMSPGAIVATALWLVASLAFRFYMANFSDYQASYGTIGGVIVLLLWFYVSGVAVLVGAEMNSEIAHASRQADATVQAGTRVEPAATARAIEPADRGVGGGAWRVASATLAGAVVGMRFWRAHRRRGRVAPARGDTT